jgi:tetratricopeptide (TPR) repeat protein
MRNVSHIRIAMSRKSAYLCTDYQAQQLFERALAVTENVLGREHPSTAASLNNLALALKAQGDLTAARQLYERAVVIDEKVLGPDHPDTAADLLNLGVLLNEQGDLGGAQLLIERALQINATVLGPDHLQTARSLNSFARLLRDQGRDEEARPLFERALAIREAALGAGHPETATTLNDLAALLHDKGELAQARPYYERALVIRERVDGPDHPETAVALNNLAALVQEQGDGIWRSCWSRAIVRHRPWLSVRLRLRLMRPRSARTILGPATRPKPRHKPSISLAVRTTLQSCESNTLSPTSVDGLPGLHRLADSQILPAMQFPVSPNPRIWARGGKTIHLDFRFAGAIAGAPAAAERGVPASGVGSADPAVPDCLANLTSHSPRCVRAPAPVKSSSRPSIA